MNDTPTFIVLGGSGGIGSAVCRKLIAAGAHVIAAARDSDRLKSTAGAAGAETRSVDATDYGQLQELFTSISRDAGGLHGVACCIGSILLKPAHLTSLEEFRDTIDANLLTAFNTIKAGARSMMSGGGSIVLCASAVAQTGIPNHEAIAAAKAGIVGLTRSAAATYASRNLRVNCVAPGLTETPMTQTLFHNEASFTASLSMHALGRLGKPEDIASAIAWLLDPANDWVTGQVIGVDGGLGQIRPR
jgi:NAD(P)-dependent dehydrogenase (short-subunit alcohol dehydrogenase family)